jgi:2,3-dimethylmalate lyase
MSIPSSGLRAVLDAEGNLLVPGAMNALFARLIEDAGFPAVYVSGAAVSNGMLGEPDLGLISLPDVAHTVRSIRRRVGIPLIVDADTGFGGSLNVARTVEELARSGASAVQIEDQEFPKRCGHFDGKRVVSRSDMIQRFRAAVHARSAFPELMLVGRTDACAVHGVEEAVHRARMLAEEGADVLFVDGPTSRDELEQIAGALCDHRTMVNMVEGGKTPLLPFSDLVEMGFNIVIYPGLITRSAVYSSREALRHLAAHGDTVGILDSLCSLGEVNALLGLQAMLDFEEGLAPTSPLMGEL